MAQFTGTGSVTLPGSNARMYDIEIRTDGGFVTSGAEAHIENCLFDSDAGVDIQGNRTTFAYNAVVRADNTPGVNVDANDCAIMGNWVSMADSVAQSQYGILINSGNRNKVIGNTVVMSRANDAVCQAAIEADGEYEVVIGNTINVWGGTVGIAVVGGNGVIEANTILHTSPTSSGSGGYGIALGTLAFTVTVADNYIVDSFYGIGALGSAANACVIRGNFIYDTVGHGVFIDNDSVDMVICDNYVEDAGRTPTDTYDGIHIDTVRAFVHGNKIRAESGATRSAINIAGGDCNRVAGNDLGDPSTYATDALIDAGTDTQLTWPNDPTYGDNFTICPTSPTSP